MSDSGAWQWLRTHVDESVGMSLVRAVTGRRAGPTDDRGGDADAAATPPTAP